MRLLPPVVSPVVSLALLLAVSSCTPKEEAQEPDYDNMVMADEENGFSPDDSERDRKVIVDDPPDPQELILL